ncbi:MAG: DUF2924 domain-containing protein, partial [Phycisphaerales bacterium]|nr:DUF2924 domain-containing protein [Phycisphaerales bacterium]
PKALLDAAKAPAHVVVCPVDGWRSKLPAEGTILRREYKGRDIVVRVLEDGFEHDGETYRSLSAIAKAVTGAHWNGPLFFGLSKGRKEVAK